MARLHRADPRHAIPAERLSRTARAVRAEVFSTRRLSLAVKTAVAAAVAWYLAPYVPFADSEYSYYAPLGVLVSMSPTVIDSARAGLLSLAGLAIGIALGLGGLALVWAGVPGIVVLALVVGVGVALGGIRALAEGRDWISLAGLFVLLLSGHEADEFSSSYLLTMAFGVVVGVIANYLFLPPLYLGDARVRMDQLREHCGDALRRAAELVETGSEDADRLAADSTDLQAMADAVEVDVREADRSRRANVRARRWRRVSAENAQRWRALSRTAAVTREVLDGLAYRGSGESAGRLAEALRRVADVVETPLADPAGPARMAAAERAVRRYARSLPRPRRGVPPGWGIAADLERVVAASRALEEDESLREGGPGRR